jgi:pimeloyl-ACP methyl ester carboxylesterase
MIRPMEIRPDRYVHAGDVKLAVDDRGSGGVPMLLVHGFTGSRVDFADVIDDLATDRRVVAWDHRGHAGSTNTGDIESYTFGHLVRDMEFLVDDLGLAAFHLLGHSMGGIVAMQYALAHPERVRSLILMDTLGKPQFVPLDFMELMIANARANGMEGVADQMLEYEVAQPRVPPQNRDAVLLRVAYKLTNMDIEAYEGFGRALTAFDSLLGPLAAVRCPTTVIVGADDRGLRPAATELVQAIDGAVEVVIAEAVHSPQEENPSAWLSAMRAHLSRAERAE